MCTKILLILAAVVVQSLAAAQFINERQQPPQQQQQQQQQFSRQPPVPILRYENTATADGGNQFLYESGDGAQREEGIFLKEVTITNSEGQQETRIIPEYRGSYKYTDVDGKVVEVKYVADETGFHPQGESIPR